MQNLSEMAPPLIFSKDGNRRYREIGSITLMVSVSFVVVIVVLIIWLHVL